MKIKRNIGLSVFIFSFAFFIAFIFQPFLWAEGKKICLYFFYSNACPHCAKAKPFIKQLEEKYKSLEVHRYDIGEEEGYKLLGELFEDYNVPRSRWWIPAVFVGDKWFTGTEDIFNKLEDTIKNMDEMACPPIPILNKKKEEKTVNAAQFKAGFIYIGPVGDAGWTYAHDQGRKYLEKKLGIETIYLESVPEGAESITSMENLIALGCKVIYATSFGYMDAVQEIAKKYPNIVFEHCSGYKRAKNVGTYFGRIYQADFLAGIIAGAMSKSGKIGYVAPIPIPEVVRGVNAFTLGARVSNPNATVKVVWVNKWYDPATEKEAALSLIESGCDFIAHGQDSPAANQAAEEHGLYSIGYNSDMKKFAPKSFLTAPIWNWGPLYVEMTKSVMDGTWKSEDLWPGLEKGVVKLAPISDKVPNEVKLKVIYYQKEIEKGNYKVFQGPIRDQKGNIRVKQGQTLTDKELLEMFWFVEGVIGTIPDGK